MKRSEFLRKAILAAIAVPLGVQAIQEQPKVLSLSISHGKYKPNAISFKVSNTVLKDTKTFEAIINQYGFDLSRDVKSVIVGYEEDDFIKDIKTVIVSFV